MMPSVTRGADAGQLTRYLAGPENGHEHQRVIDSSHHLQGDLDRDMIHAVVGDLSSPGRAYPEVHVKAGQFWHCSLSIDAAEGIKSDHEWRVISRDFMVEMGFDDPPRGASRWVAVRHGTNLNGNDHVHIAASVIREDGSRVDTWHDYDRAQKACTTLEHRHGLAVLASREAGVAMPGLSKAEVEQSRRTGEIPERHRLATVVSGMAGASETEAEFVRRLRDTGTQVRCRVDKTTGRVAGYAVAVQGSKVWFAGGSLGHDLTLGSLRRDFAGPWATPEEWRGRSPAGRETARVVTNGSTYREAAAELRKIEGRLYSGRMSAAEISDAGHKVAGVLNAAATRPEYRTGDVPRAARDAARYSGAKHQPTHSRGKSPAAAMLFIQAVDPSGGGAAILLRQLMATYRAVKTAHQKVGSMRRIGMSQDTGESTRVTLDRAFAVQREAIAYQQQQVASAQGVRPARDTRLWSAQTIREDAMKAKLAKRPEFQPQRPMEPRATPSQIVRLEALASELGLPLNGVAPVLSQQRAGAMLHDFQVAAGPEVVAKVEAAIEAKERRVSEPEMPAGMRTQAATPDQSVRAAPDDRGRSEARLTIGGPDGWQVYDPTTRTARPMTREEMADFAAKVQRSGPDRPLGPAEKVGRDPNLDRHRNHQQQQKHGMRRSA